MPKRESNASMRKSNFALLLSNLAFAIWGALPLLAESPPKGAATNQTIKIGAIASLTGPAGEQGRNWLKGAELGVKELEAEGIRVTLVVEDDTTVPARAVAAFQKLTNVDRVQAILGGTWDFLAASLYPLALRSKIPLLLPTNPVEIVRNDAPNNPWVFSAALSLGAEENAMRSFLVAQKPKSLALVWPDLPWGILHAEITRRLAKELGIKVVSDQSFPMDTNYLDSLRVMSLKAREANPDLFYVVGDYQGLAIITQEFARIRFNPVILTTQHLDQAVKFSGDARRFERVYGVYPRAMMNEDFKRRFSAHFGEEPRVYAAEGYDALVFAAHAKRAGVSWIAKDAAFIWEGVAGTYRLPADRGSIGRSEAVVVRWGVSGLELVNDISLAAES